jgi:hypothetical protein
MGNSYFYRLFCVIWVIRALTAAFLKFLPIEF